MSPNFSSGTQTRVSALQIWAAFIRDYALAGGLIIGVFYAVGLVIFDLYFGAFNVVSVDLARTEYILVGFVWATLNALFILIWLRVHYLFSSEDNKPWTVKLAELYFIGLYILFLGLVVYVSG